jgi:uncharacterized protein YuzE
MHVEFDKQADALYVTLADRPVASTKSLRDGRVIDFAEDESVVGIELLGVSAGIDLAGLPHEGAVHRSIDEYNVRVPDELRVRLRAAS